MKRITWNRVTSLGFMTLLLLPALTGCSKEKVASEELEALQAEYSTAMEDIETTEDYEGVIATFKSRYEELADTYWGTEAGFDAKLWLMGSGSIGMEREDREAAQAEILDAIFAKYQRTEHMAKLASFYDSLFEERQIYLREESPHATVRAAMIYYVAQDADFQIAYGGNEVDRDAMMETRKANLQRLVDEYYDTPIGESTYGQTAERMQSAHDPAALAIGKKAPEIIGTNVDGEEMKLSDYLGKVVVIDFWGDW